MLTKPFLTFAGEIPNGQRDRGEHRRASRL
jgi:hypothetical protein